MRSNPSSISISVCVPAYGRPREYTELLESLKLQEDMPEEIIICENDSPEREELRSITASYEDFFTQNGCRLLFIANPYNLGLDGNIRALIEHASSRYIFYVGNDDYVLKDGIHIARRFLEERPVLAASRSFWRFKDQPLKPLGLSKVFNEDLWLDQNNSDAAVMLRMGAFIGGLIFDRAWAESKSTPRYDGTLYYQIYLLLHAFATGTIGYMSNPTVSARVDNPPQFGHAASEKTDFVPGKYSAEARGVMWANILKIAQETEQATGVRMHADIKRELTVKMSFHLFEMFATASKSDLKQLKLQLEKLHLFNHYLPRTLYALNLLTGKSSRHFYRAARWLLQR